MKIYATLWCQRCSGPSTHSFFHPAIVSSFPSFLITSSQPHPNDAPSSTSSERRQTASSSNPSRSARTRRLHNTPILDDQPAHPISNASPYAINQRTPHSPARRTPTHSHPLRPSHLPANARREDRLRDRRDAELEEQIPARFGLDAGRRRRRAGEEEWVVQCGHPGGDERDEEGGERGVLGFW